MTNHEIYQVLKREGVVFTEIVQKVAQLSQLNTTTVRASLNGNTRVYLSNEASQKIRRALYLLLSDMNTKIVDILSNSFLECDNPYE